MTHTRASEAQPTLHRHDRARGRGNAVLGALLLILLATGCTSAAKLMPTPNLYVGATTNPFAEVPPELQTSTVEVLYATDRVLEESEEKGKHYGYKRSRALAFGRCVVEFGQDVSWDELVTASRSGQRDVDLTLSVAQTTEFGKFPASPKMLIDPAAEAHSIVAATGPSRSDPDEESAEASFRGELAHRLLKNPVHEVYLFVHGYNNSFEDSVEVIAGLWHFFGRQGVPIAYSWPAGRAGLLRGYTYDRESSEFTVNHLKQVLRVIASCPEVQKVNIIAHSRGTDVAVTALRELHLEISGSNRSTREVLKLGTVVLAAPDLDVDVVIQKMTSVRLARVPEQFVMYVCQHDSALGISSWLFGGLNRLGTLKSNVFTPAELEALRESKTIQIIDARITNAGEYGHSYFHDNPAVSSDLIQVVRYHRPPGAENGRPLRADKKGFWVIDDDYPGPATHTYGDDDNANAPEISNGVTTQPSK